MIINSQVESLISKSPFKTEEDRSIIRRCVGTYSKINLSFSNIIERIWQVILSIFSCSIWDKAEKVYSECFIAQIGHNCESKKIAFIKANQSLFKTGTNAIQTLNQNFDVKGMFQKLETVTKKLNTLELEKLIFLNELTPNISTEEYNQIKSKVKTVFEKVAVLSQEMNKIINDTFNRLVQNLTRLQSQNR